MSTTHCTQQSLQLTIQSACNTVYRITCIIHAAIYTLHTAYYTLHFTAHYTTKLREMGKTTKFSDVWRQDAGRREREREKENESEREKSILELSQA